MSENTFIHNEPSIAARTQRRAKGLAQMVAGGTLTAAGIPMLPVKDWGVRAISDGAGLMSRGFSTYMGESQEETDARSAYAKAFMKTYAQDELAPIARHAVDYAKDTASNAVEATRKGARGVANLGSDLAQKGAHALKESDPAEGMAAFVKDDLMPAGKQAATTCAKGAQRIFEGASRGATTVVATGVGLAGKGMLMLSDSGGEKDGPIHVEAQILDSSANEAVEGNAVD